MCCDHMALCHVHTYNCVSARGHPPSVLPHECRDPQVSGRPAALVGLAGLLPAPALCGCASVEREEQRSRARVRDCILRSPACVCVFIVSDPRAGVAASCQGHNVSNVGTSCGTVSESSPRFLIHCLPSACPLSHWHFTVPVVYLVGWRPKPWTLLKVAFPGGGLSQGG